MVQRDEVVERWDVVDIYHHPLGQTIIRDPHATLWLVDHGYYHVVVLGFLIVEHKLIVTRRSLNKSAAGYWEVSGGSVKANETSLEAILREWEEEIGYRADPSMIHPLPTYVSNSDLIDPFICFDDAYDIKKARLQASEVDRIDAIDRDRLDQLIDTDQAVDCLIIFKDMIHQWLNQ